MIVTLVERTRDDVQRPLFELHDRMPVVVGRRPAAERSGISGRLVANLAVRVAERDCVQALVLQRAVEQTIDPARGTLLHEIGELILHRVGHELRADVEIAHPPAQRQLIDQRNEHVREQRKRQHQRPDEPQRQAHGA